MKIDQWRARYEELDAETARLRVERDAARAEAARAVEALDTFARAYRVSMQPFAPGIDEADGAYHWMPHGWPTVREFKHANAVRQSLEPALDWLAQVKREAAAEELESLADALQNVQPGLVPPFRKRAAALRATKEDK